MEFMASPPTNGITDGSTHVIALLRLSLVFAENNPIAFVALLSC